jgi:hypothetical protein
MATFSLRNELVFRAPARIGLLADVTDRLAGHGVDILAVRAYEEDRTGVVLVYPDDSRAAAEALEGLDGEVATIRMIVAEVPNRPGQLAAISRALADANIDISQVHATVAAGCDTATIVIGTSDDVAALEVLQKLS